MLATDMTASGSPEEKLRWAFKMYDKDGNGFISKEEMEVVSKDKLSRHQIDKVVTNTLRKFLVNTNRISASVARLNY